MKILERLFIGFPMMLSRNPIIVRIPFRIPDFSSVGESRRNNHVYFQVTHSTGYSYLYFILYGSQYSSLQVGTKNLISCWLS